MIVSVGNLQSRIKISLRAVKKLAKEVIQHEGCNCDEVSIYFITTEAICDLHEQYFQDPSPTDCISFPLDQAAEEGYRVLGDVFICPHAAFEYIAQHGGDAYEEISLYIVHGLLHLMGYDDINEKDRKAMRKAEKLHLNHLQDLGLVLRP